ncbi:MAG: 4Fe-4S binding protein [Eubacterium sp.]|nr:4Fe-4S binding protein [Eubacterium sp.]
MKITNVTAVYFSPAGTTKKVVEEAAAACAGELGTRCSVFDFTLPDSREESVEFAENDLIVFGVPVYAGRIPNKILPEIRRIFKGKDSLAVPVVTFGNRSYDNALIELRNELEQLGFHTIAGGAFVSEHVFSKKLAPGRPDPEDMNQVRTFACQAARLAGQAVSFPEPVRVRGVEPIPPYYQPLGMDGKPARFLKAKPKITEACTGCGKCLKVCPMGSIRDEAGWKVEGICIKCQACLKVCPVQAIYFDDPAFLSHIAMLENNYSRRAENEVFFSTYVS